MLKTIASAMKDLTEWEERYIELQDDAKISIVRNNFEEAKVYIDELIELRQKIEKVKEIINNTKINIPE